MKGTKFFALYHFGNISVTFCHWTTQVHRKDSHAREFRTNLSGKQSADFTHIVHFTQKGDLFSVPRIAK